MKILQLINVRWYNACAHFAITQAKALADRGHEVIVMADPDSPPAAAAKKMGLNCDTSINFSSTPKIPMNIFKFRNYIDNSKPDIVIVHRGESHVIAAIAAKYSKRGVPVVRYRGDVRFARTSMLSRWVTNHLTAGIGVSTEGHRQYYLANFLPRHVRIIYPGVDINRFRPMPEDKEYARLAKIKNGEIVIGLVGRLAAVKGHRIFIEAAKLVSLKHKNVRFIIAGEDEAIKADQLKTIVEKWHLTDRFSFFGRVDDIRKIMSLLDIGVVASTGSESISRVLLEYMAMRIPVVGTEINQIPEILAGNGVLVPPGDSIKLAETLELLITDANLRETLAEKGLTEVRDKYTMEMLGSNSERFLQEILDGAR